MIRLNKYCVMIVASIVTSACSFFKQDAKQPEYCLKCYYLGKWPLIASTQPRLSKRDTANYEAKVASTDQAYILSITRMLDSCECGLEHSDPVRTHTYCVLYSGMYEIERIGIPNGVVDTTGQASLYAWGKLCRCDQQLFERIVNLFDHPVQDSILKYSNW